VKHTNKMRARILIPFHSRIWDWRPVTKDGLYVVMAIFMLVGIIQKPTLRSYFSKMYIRGLFEKYRTFGRQKYNYLFGCLKP